MRHRRLAAGRRVAISRGGEAMGPLSGAKDAYGYNGRNEVVSARRTLGGSPVAGFDEDFAYDPIGNRVSATDYDETGTARTSTYTANNINQYTGRTVPGWASVRGLSDADATVAVNGNPAYALASGDLAYFFGSDDFDNSTGGGFAELEVSAVVSDGTNDFVSVATNRVFVPPANETYAYDPDGNQTLVTTGTGAWQVEYNGENRPVRWTRVSPDSSTPNSSTPTLVSMTFDHQGRRRLYVEVAAGVTNKLHRFTYDREMGQVRETHFEATGREAEGSNGMVSGVIVKFAVSAVVSIAAMMCSGETVDATVWCGDHSGFNVVDAIQRLEYALADNGLKLRAIRTMTAHKYDDGRQWNGIAIVSRADATTGVRKWFAVKDSRRVELRNEPDRPEKILPLSKAASVSLDAAWELCGMEGVCVDRIEKLYVEEFAKGFPWFSAETNTFLSINSDDKSLDVSSAGDSFDVFVRFSLDHADAIHRTVGSDDYSKGLRSGVFTARRRLRSALKDGGLALNFIQKLGADGEGGTNRWLGVAAVTRPGTTNMVGMGFAIHASRRIELTGVRELPDGSDVPQGSFFDILRACGRARIDADSIVGVDVRRQQQDEFIARYERLLRYVYHKDKSPVDHWVWTVTTTNGTMKIDATRNREPFVYVHKRVPR